MNYAGMNYADRGGMNAAGSSSMSPRPGTDWGPIIVAVILFVVLSPGLLFQLPAHGRIVGFGTLHTSGIAILVHAVLYFALITIFLIAIGIHVYAG